METLEPVKLPTTRMKDHDLSLTSEGGFLSVQIKPDVGVGPSGRTIQEVLEAAISENKSLDIYQELSIGTYLKNPDGTKGYREVLKVSFTTT